MSTETLKEYIQKLVALEEEEEKYKTVINNIKTEKEKINSGILLFMEDNKITEKEIIYGNKKIKYASQKVTENISKKMILEKLTLFFQSDEMAKKATNYIYDERTSNTKNYIKISSVNSNNST
jgi:hypothetical protein